MTPTSASTSAPTTSMTPAMTPVMTPAQVAQAQKQLTAITREMEQHGEKMAGWANMLATMLLAVFSTASLLSLSLAAFNKFMAQTAAGHLDIPDALSVLLNLLLVLAMDMAMFYAASVIRAVASAGGARREMAVHVLVMATASLLETATYIYLVVQYDRPTNAWLWAIGIGRGVAAPLFATYLSLARKLPVAPRDIAYYVALLSGKGVLNDVAIIAADSSAPLHGKVDLYTSAATMNASEQQRFNKIIAAAENLRAASSPAATAAPAATPAGIPSAKRQEEQPPTVAPAEQPAPAPTPAVAPSVAPSVAPTAPKNPPIPLQPRLPRAPQTEREPERQPALAPAARQPARQPMRQPMQRRGLGRANLPSLPSLPARQGDEEPDEPAPADRANADRAELRRKREEAARSILAENPTISANELARRIAMATRTRIGETTARSIRDAVLTDVLAERKTPPLRVIEGYATDAIDVSDDEERRRN